MEHRYWGKCYVDRLNNKVHSPKLEIYLERLRSSKEDNVAGSKWTKLKSGKGGEGCEGDQHL